MRSTALDSLFSSSSPTPAHHSLCHLTSLPPIPSSSSAWFSCVAAGAKGREAVSLSSSAPSTSTRRRDQGARRVSRGIDVAAYPDVVVREARLEDCWEVAETHCSSFFPDQKFPLDLALRLDRFVAQLAGFYSVPSGCMRSCLVAVAASRDPDEYRKLGFRRATVAGILTVDTMADYLPRKGPFRSRRTGIAYISNVAVREEDRRRGIGKQLVAEAEALARGWGCRAITLHCDVANAAAVRLYRSQGYKSIPIPERANWPQPRTSPDIRFNLMMKLL